MTKLTSSCLKMKFKFIKSFSTAELKATEPSIKNIAEKPSVPSAKEVIINHSDDKSSTDKSPMPKLLEHPVFKKLQAKTFETGSKLTSFARGPLRSNLLVSLEFVKLISAEQRLIPALSTWPQAKSSYISTFNSFKAAWDDGKVNLNNFKEMVKEVTWGQAGRVLRISAEMASFYYIGELLGMLISLPFK